ncbi:MAG: hypothetical protein U0133_22150 [Gemmatimonadales bacterium]
MRRTLLSLLLVGGCAHSEPFADPAHPPLDRPFQDAQPLQLTYSIGLDEWPSWSPDERRVYYGAQDPANERDACLASLPATGGTATALQCPASGTDGLTVVFENPASDGTRLAWVQSVARADAQARPAWSLWIKPLAPAGAPTLVQQYPVSAPGGAVIDLPRFLQWLRPGVLLYLGSQSLGCCGAEALQVGQQVGLLDLTGPAPVSTFVPGTVRATAVSGTSDGLAIVYTLQGDSLVYRRVLATGLLDTLHNFGSGHIARDPVLRGTTLAALVDGFIRLDTFPPYGEAWVDQGGQLNLVDLGTHTATQVEDLKHWWRHLRPSLDGNRLLAEGYPYEIRTITIGPNTFITDTVISPLSDIWLWQ